jgi:hypothetical protein
VERRVYFIRLVGRRKDKEKRTKGKHIEIRTGRIK